MCSKLCLLFLLLWVPVCSHKTNLFTFEVTHMRKDPQVHNNHMQKSCETMLSPSMHSCFLCKSRAKLYLVNSPWFRIPVKWCEATCVYIYDCCVHFSHLLLFLYVCPMISHAHLQIHLMTFQGTRYCAKDPTLVNPDEIKAARGELQPPYTRDD